MLLPVSQSALSMRTAQMNLIHKYKQQLKQLQLHKTGPLLFYRPTLTPLPLKRMLCSAKFSNLYASL